MSEFYIRLREDFFVCWQSQRVDAELQRAVELSPYDNCKRRTDNS